MKEIYHEIFAQEEFKKSHTKYREFKYFNQVFQTRISAELDSQESERSHNEFEDVS